MDACQRTRMCVRTRDKLETTLPRGAKQICVPMNREAYDRLWPDATAMRRYLDELRTSYPELFPAGMEHGFQLTGHLPESKKLPGIRLRQLRLADGHVFTLRPSFVLSYMAGTVEDVEYPLLLLSFGVPTWVVTRGFGRSDMYWHRLVERLGRNSLAGTTVRKPEALPQHLAADEHHADWCGEKGYVALTAGKGCLLGLALTATADDEHLRDAYGTFSAEARDVDPTYTPATVNTDGWKATQKAWRTLFATIAVVLCYLHGFLKIRDRSRKDHDLHRRIWEVYWAATKGEFSKRMQAFRRWWQGKSWTTPVREALEKLWNHRQEYAVSYQHPGCHRTSNLVDRLTNRLYRVLYAGRGLHGHQASSEHRLRGWALLLNFRPYAPRSGPPREYQSPAHALNGFKYHDHWLHNLQVSASMAGYRQST
jgi:hypothetical protein